MFCSSCGAQIPDDSKFCPKCGNPQMVEKRTTFTQDTKPIKMNAGQASGKAMTNRNSRGKLIPIIVICAAVVIVLCIVINNGSSGSYESAITNLLKVKSGDYTDTSEAISLLVPRSISDDLSDLYDIAFSSSYVQAVYGSPISYQGSSSARMGEITASEKLDKDTIDAYQAEINGYGRLNFLGTGGYGVDLIAYGLGISESDAKKALKDINNIQDTLSSAKVSDGYAVSFTYTDDDGEHEEDIDVICVDGSWVTAPDKGFDGIDWTSLLYG